MEARGHATAAALTAEEEKRGGDERVGKQRGEIGTWKELRHICAAMMCARQPSAVILDHSQVEQRYRLALCLPACSSTRRACCLSAEKKKELRLFMDPLFSWRR